MVKHGKKCAFILSILIGACSVETKQIKTEATNSIISCENSFVINTRRSYSIFKYDDELISKVGAGALPGALEQVSLNCNTKKIIATFNLYGAKGLSDVKSGVYIVDKYGAVDIQPIDEIPYFFEQYGSRLIVDTGLLFSGSNITTSDMVTSQGTELKNSFTYLLDYDLAKAKIVYKYPYGGPTPLFRTGKFIYAFDVPLQGLIRINLETHTVEKLFYVPTEKVRLAKYAALDDGRLFMLVGAAGTTVVYPNSGYKVNTLYEIVDKEALPLLDMKDTCELVATDKYIYVFTYGAKIVYRYSLETKEVKTFTFPYKYLNNITFDGKNFIIITGPKYKDIGNAKLDTQNIVHVVDVMFKNVRSYKLAQDAVGISVPRHGSGGQS